MWAQNGVTLSGRITNVATGLPVENAIVKLVAGSSSDFGQTSFTDANGNYSFDDAVPGAGRVEITAEGFVAFQKTNSDDTTIQIASDHAEHNFKLAPGATITGRIAGQEGAPREAMLVTLLCEDFIDGVKRFVVGGETEKSIEADMSSAGLDGSFRFTGLAPGRYILRAEPVGSEVRPRDRKEPLAEYPTEGYVSTYYPGTTEFADALPFTLATGETRVADFLVARRPLSRVSGEIEIPGVESGQVFFLLDQTNGSPFSALSTFAPRVSGAFVVGGLPAGQYTARADAVPVAAGQSASVSFAITDHDVDGLKLVPRFREEMAVDGAFRMANSGSPLPAGLSVQYAYSLPGPPPDSIPAAPTGTFWLGGEPGTYSVQPLVPAGYAVTEVRYGGANYLNALIPMTGNTSDTSLIIVLSDQPGAVAGSIVDGQQKPVPAKVELLPDPLPANFDFRAIRVVKNDSLGAFSIGGLAPGRYKAVALTGDDRKQDHDMTLLGPKLGRADSFEVTAGQSVSVNLRP